MLWVEVNFLKTRLGPQVLGCSHRPMRGQQPKWVKRVKLLVGASPHIDEFAVNFPYICICHTLCYKSFATLILRKYPYVMRKNYSRIICRQSNGILDGVDKTCTINSPPPQWCCYLHCSLPHSSFVEVTQRWGLAHVESDSESASTIPDSLLLCCASFCVTFCDLKSQSHSDDGHVHATAPCSVRVFTHTRPTMSCTPLMSCIPLVVGYCPIASHASPSL